MDELVSLEVLRLGESLGADVAGVGQCLIARMDKLVPLQVVGLLEGLGANVAHVRPVKWNAYFFDTMKKKNRIKSYRRCKSLLPERPMTPTRDGCQHCREHRREGQQGLRRRCHGCGEQCPEGLLSRGLYGRSRWGRRDVRQPWETHLRKE